MDEKKGYIQADVGGGRAELRPVNYAGNSHSSKSGDLPPPTDPQKKPPMEAVASGILRKKPGGIFGKFIQEDLSSVVRYVIDGIIIPQIKDTIADIFAETPRRILYGERRSSGRSGTYTNYQRVGTNPRGGVREPPPAPRISENARATHHFDEVILPSRVEAQQVLDNMQESISAWGYVTVSDFYAAAGIAGEFTDDGYGWRNLTSASVSPVRGGYTLRLPMTVAL